MQVEKRIINEYQIGILWNMGREYIHEMMLKIATMENIIQVRTYDLGNKYNDFVFDCYREDKEAQEGGYIYEKICSMKSNNKRVIVFVLEINNPTYKIDINKKKQCIQTRRIKEEIRKEYSPKIDGYFFDNLIHMSDNSKEMESILKVLNEYESYSTIDYVRKGYEPIITNYACKYKIKTYIDLLKELKQIRYEYQNNEEKKYELAPTKKYVKKIQNK